MVQHEAAERTTAQGDGDYKRSTPEDHADQLLHIDFKPTATPQCEPAALFGEIDEEVEAERRAAAARRRKRRERGAPAWLKIGIGVVIVVIVLLVLLLLAASRRGEDTLRR